MSSFSVSDVVKQWRVTPKKIENAITYVTHKNDDLGADLLLTLPHYLVAGLEHFSFFHTLGMSSSQLTNSYFSEGWLNHQPVNNCSIFLGLQNVWRTRHCRGYPDFET